MPGTTHGGFVEPIRSVSRQLVRKLGFMSSTLAGTEYTASAVHTLIEIGNGTVQTAAQLADVLNVEVSVVEDLIRNLVEAGDVADINKAGTNAYVLTSKGRQLLAKINAFAQTQVSTALSNVSIPEAEQILHGLQIYTASLGIRRDREANPVIQPVQIVRGYRPGLLARTLQMHMDFYSRTAGFGAHFECSLANTLADTVSRLQEVQNEVWLAVSGDTIVGTVYIDGQHLGSNRAHLRAFIVDSGLRGGGIGRRLLAEAIKFTEDQNFDETHLWTFQGLEAARQLYESFGVVLVKEAEGTQWGQPLIEQLFVRKTKG